MNVPKKLYVAAAAVIFVAGGATVLALKPEPKEVTFKQSSSVTKQEEQPKEVAPVVEAAPVSQPVAQPTTAVEPAPEPTVPNPYVEGSSTWYVFNRRTEIGRPLPTGLGNGSVWDDRAFALGLKVDNTPEIGAVVMLNRNGVGIVDAINADGTVNVSYMTNLSSVLTAEKAAATNYIH